MVMQRLAFMALLAAASVLGQTPALAAKEFETLHQQLVPRAEAWESIGWKTDLGEACALSAKMKRPVFLWAMNGHPLGCT